MSASPAELVTSLLKPKKLFSCPAPMDIACAVDKPAQVINSITYSIPVVQAFVSGKEVSSARSVAPEIMGGAKSSKK